MMEKKNSGSVCLNLIFLFCIAALTGQLALPALTLSECADAPILSNLPQLLDNPDELARLAPSSLSITPRTYIRLQPAVRKALGKSLSVCPGIPITDSGNPIMPVKLDFADIWEPLQISVAAGNWENAAFIRRNFRANPLPPEALFSLLTIPPYGEDTFDKFAQVFGIHPFRRKAVDVLVGLQWVHKPKDIRFFALDVFHVLGGMSAKKCRVGWSSSYREIAAAASRAATENIKAIIVPYTGYEIDMAKWSLNRCGVEAVRLENYFE